MIGQIEDITSRDLIQMIVEGLASYDYAEGDINDDSITITTNEGKHIYINVELDTGEIDD